MTKKKLTAEVIKKMSTAEMKKAVAKRGQEPVASVAPPKPKKTKAEVTVNRVGPMPVPSLARSEAFRVELLDNWVQLNLQVKNMSEEECKALIDHEREGRCRPNVILRLHGRFNKLRGLREKLEFMRSAKDSK
jgi:hypothetical protein